MPRIKGNHCSIEKRASIGRRSSYNVQVFMRKCQQVQVAYKLIESRRLAQQQKFFLLLTDRNAKIARKSAVLNGSLYTTFRLTMLDAVFRRRCAKTLSVSKQVDGFEKVCFALTVQAGEQIGSRGGKNLQFVDIPVMKETQSCKIHS